MGWWWPLLAAVSAVVAVLAGSRLEISVPAATLAVVGAVLTVVEAIARQRSPARGTVESTVDHPGGLREAFTGGEPGREDLVLACDLLERKLSRPDLPARTSLELAQIVLLPPEEFRQYLAWRLDELESSS